MRLAFSRAAVVAVVALAAAACGAQRAAPPAAGQSAPPGAGQNGPAAFAAGSRLSQQQAVAAIRDQPSDHTQPS